MSEIPGPESIPRMSSQFVSFLVKGHIKSFSTLGVQQDVRCDFRDRDADIAASLLVKTKFLRSQVCGSPSPLRWSCDP